ncbi:MAG: iron-containing redox enzyme family protein [Nitrospiraceae bacterium]
MRHRENSEIPMPSAAVRMRGRPQSTHPEKAPPQRPPLAPHRRSERESLSIPFRLRMYEKEVCGSTQDLSPHGLRLMSDTALRAGTPLALQCNFAGICYLNLAAQVVFCKPGKLGTSPNHAIGIKFAAMREWEENILASALQALKQDPATQGQSLLTILVSKDTLAQEAANLSPTASNSNMSVGRKGLKGQRNFTLDPPWIVDLKRQIEPYRKAILECRLVQQASAGTLSLPQMRAWIIQLYPFIETFPKWIALNIAKTRDSVSRGYMIDNVRMEKRHAEMWVYMAQGFGINPEELNTVEPLPEVDSLTHWLWSINTQGTLAEAVGATNYAIEGVTHDIAKLMLKGFPYYNGVEEVHLDKKSYWWAEAHARYDDLHPIQALEIMKLYTTTKDLEEKVTFATRRSLEYLLMAAQACYTHFQPETVKKQEVTSPR